jgi:hypothetical protein
MAFSQNVIIKSVGYNVRASNGTINEGKSATSFCCLVAALFPDMFWNFYLAKSHKIAKNSTTTKARQKIITYLEILRIFLTKFITNQILLNKISHRFILMTKLYTG